MNCNLHFVAARRPDLHHVPGERRDQQRGPDLPQGHDQLHRQGRQRRHLHLPGGEHHKLQG